MKSRFVKLTLSGLVAGMLLSTAAYAQIPPDPNHPRVNEVNNRLNEQQNRINQGVASGKMTQGQAAADERHDASIARQEKRDEMAHGGHLTKGEQKRLNHRENHNSGRIYNQKHP